MFLIPRQANKEFHAIFLFFESDSIAGVTLNKIERLK